MKTFLIKVVFLIAPLLLVVIISLVIPPGKKIEKSMLFAQVDKNNLLIRTAVPRIIFVGGSNLSFSLDCQMVKDSLKLNPINTAIHAGLGLKYMLKNTMRYIHKGDIIIIAPEYQQFFGDQADGKIELLSMICDVSPDTKNLLDMDQYLGLIKNIPKYTSSKLNPFKYIDKPDTAVDIYERKSYNSYGDAYKHWTLPRRTVSNLPTQGELNNDAITALFSFREQAISKGAKVYLTYPSYQDASFDESVVKVKEVENKLKENKFILLGTPERYRFADSLFFNTAYHLTRKGGILRTQLLIDDIKAALKSDNL